MKYMLDTNICIYAIKQKPESVIRRFLEHDPEEMCISAITYAELMHGVEKSMAVEKNRLAMSLFLSPITILDFDDHAALELPLSLTLTISAFAGIPRKKDSS